MSRRMRRKNRRGRVSGRLVQMGFAIVLFLIAGFWLIRFLPEETASNANKTDANEDPNRIENGIHVRTGLIDDEGLMTVVANCTA